MGDVDISIKNFLKINSVFAQLFSQGVYGGEVEIDPDKLQELDTVVQDAVRLSDGQLKNVERLRDVQKVAMLFDGRMEFQIILGAEGQTGGELLYAGPVYGTGRAGLLVSVQADCEKGERE